MGNLKGCQKLRKLHLGSNQISNFPAGLGLSSLEYIELHYNKLTAFPQALLEYSKTLEVIQLSGNALKSLPDALGKMPNLRALFVDETGLSSLPSTLGSSGNLWGLTASNNQLTSLPDALFKSKSLLLLDLSLNRLTRLPDGIVNPNYDSIDLQLNYLDVSQGSKTLQQIDKISAQEKYYNIQLTPIRNLKATPGKDQIKLTWNPCPDVTGDPDKQAFVSHYDVYLKENNKLNLQSNIQKSSTPTFIDTGLTEGAKREYSVAVIYEVETGYGSYVSRSYSSISAEIPIEETTTTTAEPTTTEITTTVTTTTATVTTPDQTETGIDPSDEADEIPTKGYLKWIVLGVVLLLLVGAFLVWYFLIRPKKK